MNPYNIKVERTREVERNESNYTPPTQQHHNHTSLPPSQISSVSIDLTQDEEKGWTSSRLENVTHFSSGNVTPVHSENVRPVHSENVTPVILERKSLEGLKSVIKILNENPELMNFLDDSIQKMKRKRSETKDGYINESQGGYGESQGGYVSESSLESEYDIHAKKKLKVKICMWKKIITILIIFTSFILV